MSAARSLVLVATAYGGPEHLQLIERDAPSPRAGEIAIAVRAAGVNPADVKRREGLFGTSGPLPLAMGLEAAGVVTALGDGVEDVAVGDEVLGAPARGQGSFAERTVLRAADSVRKPAALSFAVAATLPVAGTTAYDLLHQVPLEAGDTVLVLGAGGGVGRSVLQIARARGLRAIGVASEGKCSLIEETGARHVPSGDGAADAVRDLAPEGASLLVDLVGGAALRALAPLVDDPSRLVSAADEDTATALGGTGRARSEAALAGITELAASGQVTPCVLETFPLVRAAQAIARLERGHLGGKLVIEP
ncbi:NADP-dependent oxidoreductase [Brachybacterium sp. AOP43-C2-M15]|uniref:NADP-dependent oxidoreductase n=1 Tax=Brachybacterium sp. AOP43-C2-M15 TaxID=3457661 RepID=UPI0040336403